MTVRILNRWSKILQQATREGWPPEKLDQAMAAVR
jgi:hypothetical protein